MLKNSPTSILVQAPTTMQLYNNIHIRLKSCPKGSLPLWLLRSSHTCSSMVGLQPAQEDKEPSPPSWLSGLTLRCPASKYILMGSGKHPTGGCPAPNYVLMGSGEHPTHGHAAFLTAGFLQCSTSMITALPAREAGLN